MVTSHKFKFEELFDVTGGWRADDAGDIHVQGHVRMKWSAPTLTYTFAHVSGDFDAGHKGLTSLKGLPEQVGGTLYIGGNRIQNLINCSRHVGEQLWINDLKLLHSLEGMPRHVGSRVFVTWQPELPLLRCLVAPQVQLGKPNFITQAIHERILTCERILNDERWVGKGKLGMLNCALELKRAGLEGNASW
jgi:hypothetical protein